MNVVAVAVDVGVVLEEDVKGRPGSLCDSLAVINSNDDVGDFAVLADDPKAKLLKQTVRKGVERSSQRLLTSPGNRLVQSALMVALFTEASWKLETFSLAEISSQVSPATTV